MPLYEYYCADCHTKFEKLWRTSQIDDSITCQNCNSPHTSRVFSTFAATSRSSNGQTRAIAGTCNHCAGCGTRNCSSCNHH